jgi:hypothetical protein
MIAKHIPMRAARRSSFHDLVTYIAHTQDKAVRIGAVRVTNCHQDSARDAVNEVLAVQLQNRRACSDKTYHLLISFDADDSPSLAALRDIEDALCESLGFAGHQRVSAVHTDTDNLHIHVAINKIHPATLTIHNPYCDYKTLGAVCQRLELAHGLVATNHETIARGARNAALDMEHSAGMESLLGWIRRECLEELRAAQSWRALHQVLGQSGLVLREQGNGFIVSDQEGRAVKASSIARDLSKAQLSRRLGTFEADGKKQVQATRAYRTQPILAQRESTGSGDLYQRYQAEQSKNRQARVKIRRELHQQKQDQLSRAKEKARIRRGIIRELGCDSLSRRALYHQAGCALRDELQAIYSQHQARCELLLAPVKPLAWFDWLAQRATQDAAALEALRRRRHKVARAARRANSLLGAIREGRGGEPAEGMTIDSVTRQGTIIYVKGESAIRDSGSRLEVSEGIRQDGLEIALSMAMQRFGRNITIEGDSAFRQRVQHIACALKLDIAFTDRTGKQAQQAQAAALPDEAQTQAAGEPERERLDLDPGVKAARRYIIEREAKRQKIAGIPKHVLGEARMHSEIRYAGWRKVNGQFLLLAASGTNEMAVIPVDATTVARVSGTRLGEPIRLDGNQPRNSRGLKP